MTPAGLEFLSAWEGGAKLRVYQDSAGLDTIGVGHLVKPGEDFSDGITEAQALALLAQDVRTAEKAVTGKVAVPLEPHQSDALISFTFNVGVGAFKTSTLLRRLNAGRYQDVPAQLARWNRAGGRVVRGLTRRREAEGVLFSTGEYRGP